MLNSQTQNVFTGLHIRGDNCIWLWGSSIYALFPQTIYIYNWKVKLDDKAHACSKWKPNSNESATEISFLALLTVEVWNSNQPSRKPASFLAPLKGSVFWKAPGWSSSRIAEVADRPNPTARWVHGRSGDRAVASDGRRSWHSWVPGCQRGLKEVWLLVAGWSFKWNLYKQLIYVPSVKKSIYMDLPHLVSCAWCASSPMTNLSLKWGSETCHTSVLWMLALLAAWGIGIPYIRLNQSYTSFELLFSTQLHVCVCVSNRDQLGPWFPYLKRIMWKDITM